MATHGSHFGVVALILMFTVAPYATAGDITFTKDVAPILNENCVICHRAGEAVPFTLTSYEEIRPWAKSIRKMVDSRLMPPWHADASVGHWKNDRRLSVRYRGCGAEQPQHSHRYGTPGRGLFHTGCGACRGLEEIRSGKIR